MKMNRATLTLIALMGLGTVAGAQEDSPADEGENSETAETAETVETAETTATPAGQSPPPSQGSSPESFRPSEELTADSAISFPIDI